MTGTLLGVGALLGVAGYGYAIASMILADGVDERDRPLTGLAEVRWADWPDRGRRLSQGAPRSRFARCNPYHIERGASAVPRPGTVALAAWWREPSPRPIAIKARMGQAPQGTTLRAELLVAA